MLRNLVTASIICLGLFTLTGTQEAKAWPTTVGWGWTPGSIKCYSDWKGIGNTEINPTTAICNGYIMRVLVNCINNGGGTGGVGIPFEVDVDVSGDSMVLPDPDGGVDGRGQGSAEVYFEDSEIYDALLAAGIDAEDVCQNHNWYIDPTGGVTVLNALVQILGVDENGVVMSELWGECTLNTEAGVYDCTTISNVKVK